MGELVSLKIGKNSLVEKKSILFNVMLT